MPRVGGGGSGDHRPHNNNNNINNNNEVTAYSDANRRLFHWNGQNILIILVLFFMIKNILLGDYRQEEINQLRSVGISDEEIDKKYVPKTFYERKKDERNEKQTIKQMSENINYLLNEVYSLKQKMDQYEMNNNNNTTSSASLSSNNNNINNNIQQS